MSLIRGRGGIAPLVTAAAVLLPGGVVPVGWDRPSGPCGVVPSEPSWFSTVAIVEMSLDILSVLA